MTNDAGPTRTSSEGIAEQGASTAKLRRRSSTEWWIIALLHKCLLISLASHVLGSLGLVSKLTLFSGEQTPMEIFIKSDYSLVFFLLISLLGAVGITTLVLLLAWRLYSVFVAVLLAGLSISPLMNIVIALIIDSATRGQLRAQGYRVGLLGAKMAQFDRAAPG